MSKKISLQEAAKVLSESPEGRKLAASIVGKHKTPKKAEASRRNGSQGGRGIKSASRILRERAET